MQHMVLNSATRAPFKTLVLASGSPYRRELLSRLQLPFIVEIPQVDESPLPNEAPEQIATRLAETKTRAAAARHPRACIIGSDQVAFLDGQVLGKPLYHQRAVEQLQKMRGRTVHFHTGLCVLDQPSGQCYIRQVPTAVRLRSYSDAAIETYLNRERPYDCTGSAKSEGLGIALIEHIDSSDPSALIGLPLIALVDLLSAAGYAILS